MSAAGIEPATNGLKGHCSTIELRARIASRILSREFMSVNVCTLWRLTFCVRLVTIAHTDR